MNDVFAVAEVLVSHAVESYWEDVDLIGYYGSHARLSNPPTQAMGSLLHLVQSRVEFAISDQGSGTSQVASPEIGRRTSLRKNAR